MRVLISTEFYLPTLTGIVTAVLNQKKSLEDRGHSVRILAIGDTDTSYFSEKEKVYYIKKTKWQPYPDSYATFSFSDSLLDEICTWSPDIVHANGEFFTMILARKVAKRCHVPLIDTCHTDFDEYYIHFIKSRRIWDSVIPKVIRFVLKDVDFVVCPTQKNFDMLDRYRVKNPKAVIPVGLDLAMFAQELSPQERTNIRRYYGFSDDDFVFTSICRLSPEKNISEAIDNYAQLRKQKSGVKMLIVGDGTARKELERQVMELNLSDDVKFAGSVPRTEVWKYFKCGEAFISASRSEIQGLTYIEALASGIPLLCLKDQSLSGTLQEGINGFGYSNRDDFLEKAILLISDKTVYNKLKDASSGSVTQYSLEAFSCNLEKLYRRLIQAQKDKTCV